MNFTSHPLTFTKFLITALLFWMSLFVFGSEDRPTEVSWRYNWQTWAKGESKTKEQKAKDSRKTTNTWKQSEWRLDNWALLWIVNYVRWQMNWIENCFLFWTTRIQNNFIISFRKYENYVNYVNWYCIVRHYNISESKYKIVIVEHFFISR